MTWPRRWRIVLLAAGLLLVVRALQVRVPQLARPFWNDECVHSAAILRAPSLRLLPKYISYTSQPVLESALRREVWFPLLGWQERALRLPSLVYSVLALLSGLGLAVAVLRRRGVPPSAVVLGASLAGLWLVNHPTEGYLSAEARHYTFVSLVSLWWFSAWLLWERCPPALFALLSLIFANAHFFALPLIATAYALDAPREFRRGGLLALAWHASWVFAVFYLTRRANIAALNLLAASPPGHAPGWHWSSIAAGLGLYRQLQDFVHLPVPVLVVWAALCFAWRRSRVLNLLVVSFLFMPAFLVFSSVRSDYPFGWRYFMPFFGLGFVSVVLACCHGYRLWEWARVRRPVLSGGAGSWVLALALLVLFKAPASAWGLIRSGGALTLPLANSSPYFHMYEEIKRVDRPVMILRKCPWGDDVTDLYLDHIGVRFPRRAALVYDGMAGLTRRDAARLIERFPVEHPDGLVVLDRKEEECPDVSPPRRPGAARVWRIPGERICVWYVQGARDAAEIRRIARAVGFASIELFWKAP
ncbi:MAG: hypothetical protein AAB152_19060 [Candidatus Coatesbacteria bacterium]